MTSTGAVPVRGRRASPRVFAALKRNGYAGDISVESMEYVPDGPGAASRAIGYVRGILEALEASETPRQA